MSLQDQSVKLKQIERGETRRKFLTSNRNLKIGQKLSNFGIGSIPKPFVTKETNMKVLSLVNTQLYQLL